MAKGRCSTTSEQDTQPSVEGVIAQIEAATEGSRELDAEIYLSLSDWKNAEVVVQAFPRSEIPSRPTILRRTVDNHIVTYSDFPAYTTSIDAALTLVPQGCVWTVLTDFGGLCRARIYDGRDALIQKDGETPPLALCIAALRARQAVPHTVLGTPSDTSNTDSYPHTTTAPTGESDG